MYGLKHQKEKRSMNHFAGLDVSVKQTSVCIVDDTGKTVREVKVASEPEALLGVVKNPAYRFKRIGLEAGTAVTIHTPDGVLNGLDGASALLQAYATAFPDFRLVIDDLVADADRVAFRWTFNGTHRGPLATIPASGKQVSVSNNVGIFRIADG